MRKLSIKAVHIATALIVVLATILPPQKISAAPLDARSIIVSSSLPSASSAHTFNFTLSNVSTVGSIEFEYCSNSPFVGAPCTAPTGFSTVSATLATQTGETGFSIDASSTVNRLVLTRTPIGTSAIPVQYIFNNITNHDTPNSTVYVRIATYATSNGTGPRTDTGTVAYSTASGISVAGYVPPYLTFCVGVTVALNCSSSSGVLLNFGELATNQPRFLSSQFSVATNDPGGYMTFVAGPTMTSGNNVIPGLDPPGTTQSGTSQFGMNLRANSNPSVGADPAGVGTGSIASGFNIPNQFFFRNQVITSSPLSSDFNAFTVSYLVNISGAQQPGVYSTTLTYIATAAF